MNTLKYVCRCGLLGLAFIPLASIAQVAVEPPKEPVVVQDYQPPASDSQIVIRSGDEEGATYYEYRVGGEIVEIKVVPASGPEYYLVPVEGGWARESSPRMRVPSWVLFRW